MSSDYSGSSPVFLGPRGGAGAAPAGGPSRETRVSRAAQIRAAKQERGMPFALRYTGGEARVTWPSLMWLLEAGLIPSTLTGIVDGMIAAGGGAPEDKAGAAAELMFAEGGIKAAERMTELVNITCIAGFLDPQLVATPEAITDPDAQMVVTEIDYNDRYRFFALAQRDREGEAEGLTTFRPEPAAAAGGLSGGDDVRGAGQ